MAEEKDPLEMRPNESMGVTEWARWLGVSRQTVTRHFKTFKLGRRRLLQKKFVARQFPHLFRHEE